jgi:hypothetical protein
MSAIWSNMHVGCELDDAIAITVSVREDEFSRPFFSLFAHEDSSNEYDHDKFAAAGVFRSESHAEELKGKLKGKPKAKAKRGQTPYFRIPALRGFIA